MSSSSPPKLLPRICAQRFTKDLFISSLHATFIFYTSLHVTFVVDVHLTFPLLNPRIIVERLFKSCIVPYNFDTKERVKSLFTCYQLADDASIKAIQELLKVQFV